MKRFSEKSTDIKNELFWMWMAVIGLSAWLLREVVLVFEGRANYGDLMFIVLFACLLAWRFAVKYEYILDDKGLIVKKQFLFYESSVTIPLESVETFSDKYKRKLVIRQKISRFCHWYSSGDTRPTRVLTYMHNKKRIILIFKASDIFMDKLISRIPDRFEPCMQK